MNKPKTAMRYSARGARSRRLCIITFCSLLLLLVISARRQGLAEETKSATPAPSSAFEAIATIKTALTTGSLLMDCGGMKLQRTSDFALSGEGLSASCPGGGQTRIYNFRDRVRPDKLTTWNAHVMRACLGSRKVQCEIMLEGRDTIPAFIAAWNMLSQPRAAPADDGDAAFRAALERQKSAPASEEARHRAEVRAEALLGAKQNLDAALVYEEALQGMPDWPQGHYNFALVSANLGFYPEAIVEMRRYLYLAPDAGDARAARDQTYKWEALLAAGPTQR